MCCLRTTPRGKKQGCGFNAEAQRKGSPSCARIGKLKRAPPKQSELRSDGQGRALSHKTHLAIVASLAVIVLVAPRGVVPAQDVEGGIVSTAGHVQIGRAHV